MEAWDEQQRARASDNNFPITTLDRLLSARDVRSRIGVDVKDRTLVSTLSADELIKPLRRMVLDLAEKRVNVSQLKNKAQQNAYIDSFDAASRANLQKKTVEREVSRIEAGEFKSKPAKKRKAKGPPDASERRTVVAKGVKLAVAGKPSGIFKELRTLKLDDAPTPLRCFCVFFSSSPLMRTLLRMGCHQPSLSQGQSGR